jgi:dolichol-phosphate mannosyltransferase
MSDDTAIVFPEERVASPPLRAHTRVRHAMTQPHNWVQLGKFCAVGGTGYALNLGVFALLAVQFHMHHLVAATLAFLVAVMNNFWLNRHWTFSAKEAHPMGQAIRFFAISLVVYGFSYVVLVALVDAGFSKVIAQAIAIAAGTPLSFVGQKLWSFKA